MPDPVTGQHLLVLHTVRCIGAAGTERVADASGLTTPDAESVLIDLAVDGLMTRVPGVFAAWALTEAGRRADAVAIAAELDAAGGRADVPGPTTTSSASTRRCWTCAPRGRPARTSTGR